jgi:hypothetical protein
MRSSGIVYSWCGCREPNSGRLGARCPQRGHEGHGSWYLSLELPGRPTPPDPPWRVPGPGRRGHQSCNPPRSRGHRPVSWRAAMVLPPAAAGGSPPHECHLAPGTCAPPRRPAMSDMSRLATGGAAGLERLARGAGTHRCPASLKPHLALLPIMPAAAQRPGPLSREEAV